MTDYNDGRWHGWNGGKCPVHPESVVEFVTPGNQPSYIWKASECEWEHRANPVIAFRVIKPYVEPPKPREFWVNIDSDGTAVGHGSKIEADRWAYADRIACILVREVLE